MNARMKSIMVNNLSDTCWKLFHFDVSYFCKKAQRKEILLCNIGLLLVDLVSGAL